MPFRWRVTWLEAWTISTASRRRFVFFFQSIPPTITSSFSLAQVEHRDLKAANVLLVAEGDGLVAKICDFGSAKWRIALASTSTGDKGSTTAWSAPETYRSKGSPGVFTEASDVWSFGMLVFEIVFLKVGGPR